MKKIIMIAITASLAMASVGATLAQKTPTEDISLDVKEITYVRCEKGIVPMEVYHRELHGKKTEEIVYYRPSITFPAMTEENFHHFYRVYMSGMMKLQFLKAKSENLEGEEK